MTPAVIVAMDSELKALKSIGVKAACSGIGKVNAASAATRLTLTTAASLSSGLKRKIE